MVVTARVPCAIISPDVRNIYGEDRNFRFRFGDIIFKYKISFTNAGCRFRNYRDLEDF